VYCQLGQTDTPTIQRGGYCNPDEIYGGMKNRLKELAAQYRKPDAIAFVTNGEPSLDKNINIAIQKLKAFQIPVAMITNASLLWLETARE